MIRLLNVSKSVLDEDRRRGVIFENLSVGVPTKRNVAILSEEPRSATSFLHLLAGSEVPDGGRIVAKGVRRLSPVVYGGASLMPHLTGVHNIAFFARVHGVDSLRLVETVDSACRFGANLNKPVRSMDAGKRRELEATLVAALPFDCFLVDRLHELPGDVRWRIFMAARLRKAGFIFTTSKPEVAERFGDYFIVLRDGGARAFNKLERAINYSNGEDT
jgi:capsular polysaccharide transport system ATP-binding protein